MLVRLEERQRFPTSVDDGFRYITDPANWPEYWPGLVRVEPGGRWREPGDTTALVLRLLGREVRLEMTLERFEPPRLVEYRSVQSGLPDARHMRVFSAAEDGSGFDYRLVIEYEPRPGLRSLFDRVLVRRALARAMRQTIENLKRTIAESHDRSGGRSGPDAV